jgi:hypothetical protein
VPDTLFDGTPPLDGPPAGDAANDAVDREDVERVPDGADVGSLCTISLPKIREHLTQDLLDLVDVLQYLRLRGIDIETALKLLEVVRSTDKVILISGEENKTLSVQALVLRDAPHRTGQRQHSSTFPCRTRPPRPHCCGDQLAPVYTVLVGME